MKLFLKRNKSVPKLYSFLNQILWKQFARFLCSLTGLLLVLLIQVIFVSYTTGINAIETAPGMSSQDLKSPIQPIESIPKQTPGKLHPVQPLERITQPTQELSPTDRHSQDDSEYQIKCDQIEECYKKISLQKRALMENDPSKLRVVADNLASIIRVIESEIRKNEKQIINIDSKPEKEKDPEKKRKLLKRKNDLLRIKSYALGFLGEAYEQAKQWDDAQNITKKALVIAEDIQDKGLSYQWQWQLGRIYRDYDKSAFEQKDANIKQSMAYYRLAVDTLDKIRTDIAYASSANKYAFSTEVEPIYRDYISLLLKEYVNLDKSGVNLQDNLKEARRVISALQSSELVSFLGEPCPVQRLDFLDEVVDTKDETAALLYPIVLDDRIGVILKLPDQKKLEYYETRVDKSQVEKTLKDLQFALEEAYTFQAVKDLSQTVYKWLIEKAESYLESYSSQRSPGIKTLVFVLDSRLRNIPMAVLHNGKDYLIEKYAVAIAPRVELPNLRPLSKRKFKILAAGLTIPVDFEKEFGKLPYVKDELDAIKQTGVEVKKLLDQEFTFEKFREELNSDSFQVVHLATHGKFDDTPQNTYVLAYKKKVTANNPEASSGDPCKGSNSHTLACMFQEIDQSTLNPIELLILNACETATGDGRETLGISGISVKAGVRSAIASLWTLNDEFSVEFSRQLYQQLQQRDLSKAQALQKVQQALLKDPQYDHPRYWAPYVLVGNWL